MNKFVLTDLGSMNPTAIIITSENKEVIQDKLHMVKSQDGWTLEDLYEALPNCEVIELEALEGIYY